MGYASAVDDVAAAIADPVRREILEMLRERSLPARRIADRFAISRPAVSRHLRVLRECGLVRDTPAGRERHYRLDPTRLAEVGDWLANFITLPALDTPADGDQVAGVAGPAAAWDRRLDALATEVHRTRRDRRRADAAHDRLEDTA
jgi:DNA-binding transcriptional ArsR family regulator